MPPSRGEVIITQKEAKGEYENAVWLWNRDTTYGMPAEYGNQELEPHAFDNTNSNGIPARMTDAGKSYGYCTGNTNISNGDMLTGGEIMNGQVSCTPNTGNVGNYYSWVTAVTGDDASSGVMQNSICPRGWMLPNGGKSDVNKSFASITLAYVGVGTESTVPSSVEQALRASASSFIRSGYYRYANASRLERGSLGYYWSSQAGSSTGAYDLYFGLTFIYPRYSSIKGIGFAVRCVAR